MLINVSYGTYLIVISRVTHRSIIGIPIAIGIKVNLNSKKIIYEFVPTAEHRVSKTTQWP
jgi:hypothetical protein